MVKYDEVDAEVSGDSNAAAIIAYMQNNEAIESFTEDDLASIAFVDIPAGRKLVDLRDMQLKRRARPLFYGTPE